MICRSQVTTGIYDQGRGKFSHHITRGPNDILHNRCKGRKEGRHIVVLDIPGAFLHADMEETVHMLLEGTTAEL